MAGSASVAELWALASAATFQRCHSSPSLYRGPEHRACHLCPWCHERWEPCAWCRGTCAMCAAMCHIPSAVSPVLCGMCHVLYATCHVPPAMCHLSRAGCHTVLYDMSCTVYRVPHAMCWVPYTVLHATGCVPRVTWGPCAVTCCVPHVVCHIAVCQVPCATCCVMCAVPCSACHVPCATSRSYVPCATCCATCRGPSPGTVPRRCHMQLPKCHAPKAGCVHCVPATARGTCGVTLCHASFTPCHTLRVTALVLARAMGR